MDKIEKRYLRAMILQFINKTYMHSNYISFYANLLSFSLPLSLSLSLSLTFFAALL